MEKYFGQQRQRGKTNENPNVAQFLKNAQALRVINGVCRDVVKGNCRGSATDCTLDVENSPLPRRKYDHK